MENKEVAVQKNSSTNDLEATNAKPLNAVVSVTDGSSSTVAIAPVRGRKVGTTRTPAKVTPRKSIVKKGTTALNENQSKIANGNAVEIDTVKLAKNLEVNASDMNSKEKTESPKIKKNKKKMIAEKKQVKKTAKKVDALKEKLKKVKKKDAKKSVIKKVKSELSDSKKTLKTKKAKLKKALKK